MSFSALPCHGRLTLGYLAHQLNPVLLAAELLQEALSTNIAAANGLTSSGLAALFAEAWFPSLTPGYGAAGQPFWQNKFTHVSSHKLHMLTHWQVLAVLGWMCCAVHSCPALCCALSAMIRRAAVRCVAMCVCVTFHEGVVASCLLYLITMQQGRPYRHIMMCGIS